MCGIVGYIGSQRAQDFVVDGLEMKTLNKSEYMNFIISLNNRGLLSKSIDEFDYEWVIWDYINNNKLNERR